MEASDRICALREAISTHDYYYYALNAPVIPDVEYDSLYQELKALEARFPQFKDPNSPTQRVGGPLIGGFEKARHQHRMLSLDNTYSAGEVLSFFSTGEEVLVEPKIDGLSLKLIYKQGALVQAITRGNGDFGDDVTANARTIRSIPLTLSEPLDLIVTGEVYMDYTTFNALNARLEEAEEELFANTRNAAAGTLKLKNPADVAARKLSFVAHGSPAELSHIRHQSVLMEHLGVLGFQATHKLVRTSPVARVVTQVVTLKDEASLKTLIDQLDVDRKFLNVATDGLVFKVDLLEKQRDLGEGTKAPKWAVAFKYPPERRPTLLTDITLQVGKTGKITPVAELKPISLSGTVVKRASVCNADEIMRLNVDVGDMVLVEKSAEIIPKIVGVQSKSGQGHFVFPKTCPCCDTQLVRPAGMVDWYCPNHDCEEQVFGRLRYATGKQALDINGCGEQMIRVLMQQGVRTLSALFGLKDVSFLKSAARRMFLEGREAAKHAPLWRQIAALNIEGLGKTLCQDIANRWASLQSVLDEPEELRQVVNNRVVYQNVLDFFEQQCEELNALQAAGLPFVSERNQTGKLVGKIFVITGGLLSGSRDEVARRIEDAGGTCKPNASRKCHYLIQGEGGGRIKAEKAAQYRIPIITEQQLYELMGVPMPVSTAKYDPDHKF